jgi:signal transduction histidine kinase/ligand-binding sensor domain-containing protein
MRKQLTQALVVLSILLACCSFAFALDPALDISQYAHTAWKVRDGFAKGFIYAIAQTPDGYLWLGTEFGLLRFDGVRAVPWMPRNGQLPSNDIPTLLVTSDGTFWIGTTKGLASWKDRKLTTYFELNGSRIFALLEDRNGTVWAATREARIFGENVGPIDADAEGNFWVGFDKDSRKWKSGRPQSFEVRDSMHWQPSLAELEQIGFPTANHKRLTKSVAAQLERGASTGLSQHSKPPQILRDREGALWVATPDRGLVHIHQGKTDVFSEADGLSGDTVTGLLEDQEGDVWAVTTNGIDRFREYAVPNISIKQGLSNTNSVAIVGAKDGSVWVATYNGLNRWKDGRISVVDGIRSTQDSNRTPKGAPYTLFEDSERRIWISTVQEFGYLENNRFVPVRDVHGGRITSMAEGPSGHLWLAKEEDGLLHLFQGRVVEKFPWTTLGHNDDGRVVLADPSYHGIWMGFSAGGISYFADGAIRKSYSVAEGLGAGRVNGLRFGPRGALWAATENGLSRIKDDHVTTLTSKNGLPCDNVHWTVDDADHFVWVYTACGLVRIARSELDAWVADPSRSVRTTLFDISDGVRTHSYPSAVHSVTKASDGRIWYVAFEGVSVIDPQHFPFNKLPPPVQIEQVTADRTTYDAAQGLRLPALVRDLAIDYVALSFVAPEQVKFRYKLEGYDNEWQDAGNRRQAIYTNLPPRAYRFRLMASNNSGVWNEEGAVLDFSIAPAYYQTTWFRLALVVLFLALLWAAYMFRVRQLAMQFNRTLEARVSERTRIARDLHDTLLQSFQGLLLRFQSASKILPARPDDAKQRLDSALEQAAEAITEGRDAVQGLRSSAFETHDLANGITAIAEELTSDTSAVEPPAIDVDVEGTPRNLNPVVRDEAYRIAGEALRNAFRHARARRITVEIRYDKRHFHVTVRDDGTGIDDEAIRQQPVGHFGLHGMRERAEIVGGRLEVWSKLDSGTEVEISVPGAIAYDVSDRRSWWSRVLSGNGRSKRSKEP